MKKKIRLTVLRDRYGTMVYLNDYRIFGLKPLGNSTVLVDEYIPLESIEEAIKLLDGE